MPLLATRISAKSPFLNDPVTATITNSRPRIALILVNTLARTISPTVRPDRSGRALTFPAATRCATSSADRPGNMSILSVRVIAVASPLFLNSARSRRSLPPGRIV